MEQNSRMVGEKRMKERETHRLIQEAIPFLLQWYDYNRRILPWREEPTPYRVWVSEIMLQQTRVEAVRGYYDRFLSRLPGIRELAQVPEEELLKLWEGLGYYNRVRNMQKAAKLIVEQYGGEMPSDYRKIRELPGIGDYTAGAISSIAFGLPYPAIDGNVLRVMSRITCDTSDISKEATKKYWRETLLELMPERCGDFNQSLMELGAMVCLPNGKPLCEQCPVMQLCRAFQEDKELTLPVKAEKKERRIEKRNVYIFRQNGKELLHRRPKKGLLAGLWEYPNCLISAENLPEEFLSGASKRIIKREMKKAKHIFSHVEWHMDGYFIEAEPLNQREEEQIIQEMMRLTETESNREDWVFANQEERTQEYPIPAAFEKFKRKGETE